MEKLLRYMLRFVLLVGAQVFLFKNVGYYNLSIPFVYLLFILRLPLQINSFYLYIICLLTGLTIDTFYNTLGIHASACVVAGFARIMYLRFSVHSDKLESDLEPSISTFDFRWFVFYAVTISFIHHLILFALEAFRFSEIGFILTRTILSSIFGVFLMILIEMLLIKETVRN